MLRIALPYGIGAGLIAGGLLSALTIGTTDLACSPAGMAIGYAVMLLALTAVFLAVRRYRIVRGGVRFWPALLLGMIVTVIASATYVAVWEAAAAVTGFDFPSRFVAAMTRQRAAAGATPAEMAAFARDMARFRDDYANPSWRIPMSFLEMLPVGLLVSLVSAALLRDRRR